MDHIGQLLESSCNHSSHAPCCRHHLSPGVKWQAAKKLQEGITLELGPHRLGRVKRPRKGLNTCTTAPICRLRAEAEHAVETRRQIGQPDQVIPSRIVPAGDENRDALFDKIMSFLFMCRHSLGIDHLGQLLASSCHHSSHAPCGHHHLSPGV